MVSTGYFMVDLPIMENQIESLRGTRMLYLPMESVIVPLPEVLITATASKGLLAEISYTVPLILMDCATARCPNNPQNRNIQTRTWCSFLLKQSY